MSESRSKDIAGSSCRNRAISGTAAGFTWATRSWEGPSSQTPSTASGNRSFSLVSSGCIGLSNEDLLLHDFLLELDEPVQVRFRPRRAARDAHGHLAGLVPPPGSATRAGVVSGPQPRTRGLR